MKLSIARRYRVGWWLYEHYKGDDGHCFINIAWGHPLVHAWWALSIWLFYRRST